MDLFRGRPNLLRNGLCVRPVGARAWGRERPRFPFSIVTRPQEEDS